MTTNTEAMDAVHEGRHVTCTLEEYDPPAGIGIRGVLLLYAAQRGEVGDILRMIRAVHEVIRLDNLVGWNPTEEEAGA